jgi:hypothetical protein
MLPGHATNSTSSNCTYCPYGTSRTAMATWLCLKGLRPEHQTFAIRMGYAGRPECASINGKNCIRSITAPDGTVVSGCAGVASRLNSNPLAAGAPLRTLRCGDDHLRAWNITGYDQPQHWCLVANDFFQDNQPGELLYALQRGYANKEIYLVPSLSQDACNWQRRIMHMWEASPTAVTQH